MNKVNMEKGIVVHCATLIDMMEKMFGVKHNTSNVKAFSKRIPAIDIVDMEIDKVLTALNDGVDVFHNVDVTAFIDADDLETLSLTAASTMEEIKLVLLKKNAAYGNAAAEPVSVFAKETGPVDKIHVRLDDKLTRLIRGHEYPGDDTVLDLLGYLILRHVVLALQEEGTKEEGTYDSVRNNTLIVRLTKLLITRISLINIGNKK